MSGFVNDNPDRWVPRPKGPRPNGPHRSSVPRVMSLAEFIAQAKEPEFLIEPLFQRGYLYTLTAKTSHGKTALFCYLAIVVADAVWHFANHYTNHGRVVILAGENPDDTAARLAAMCDYLGIDPDGLPITVMPGAFDLKSEIDAALAAIAELDDVVLILVDTSTAYRFDGSEDDNHLSKEWAQEALRRLLEHPNNPTVIASTHPVKHADARNLLPRGGGSFVAEVDGNFTLWATSPSGDPPWAETRMHWQGKLRGMGFTPIVFAFFTHPHPTATFHDGRPVDLTLLMPAKDQPKEGSPAPKREKLGDNEQNALTILNRLFHNGGPARMAPVFEDGAEGLVVDVEDWRKAFYQEAMPDASADVKRKAFGRLTASLLRKSRVRCNSDLVWPA